MTRTRRRARRARARGRPARRATQKPPQFTGETTRILEAQEIARGTHWIRISWPPGFDWKAGQFTILELDLGGGKVEDHMFSIAASPTSKALEIATRRRASAFKRRFVRLKPDDTVALQPAEGSFLLDARHPAVFLTGGIGITAVKAILEYATDKDTKQPLVVLYSNTTEQDIAFREELDELAKINPRLRIEYTLTKKAPRRWQGRTGRIDAKMVSEAVAGLQEPTFYVCGPPSMVRDLRTLLVKELGVPSRRVKTENFTGYP